MMKRIVLALLFVLAATPLFAQTATPTSRVAWDIDAPDVATAGSYVYRHYDDGATTGIAFTGVQCVATAVSTVQTCTAAFPAYTPTRHTITATAANAAGESLPSTPFPFTFVVVPNAPRNLRIVP